MMKGALQKGFDFEDGVNDILGQRESYDLPTLSRCEGVFSGVRQALAAPLMVWLIKLYRYCFANHTIEHGSSHTRLESNRVASSLKVFLNQLQNGGFITGARSGGQFVGTGQMCDELESRVIQNVVNNIADGSVASFCGTRNFQNTTYRLTTLNQLLGALYHVVKVVPSCITQILVNVSRMVASSYCLHKLYFTANVGVILFILTLAASGQTPQCPPDMVCISPQAARQALENADTVKAQAAEILTLREAVLKQKEATVDVKIEYAKTLGELTGAQKELIALRAQLEFVMKNGRNKCGGLTLFCLQK